MHFHGQRHPEDDCEVMDVAGRHATFELEALRAATCRYAYTPASVVDQYEDDIPF